MRLSDEGAKFIQCWEALKLDRYWDNEDGWTIGWGHLIKPTEQLPNTITVEKAVELFKTDVMWAEDFVDKVVKVPLTQQQFDALVSLVFNIGASRFYDSTLLKLLNKGKYNKAADQFRWWRLDDGKVSNGLVKRRAQETDIFLNGIYQYEH